MKTSNCGILVILILLFQFLILTSCRTAKSTETGITKTDTVRVVLHEKSKSDTVAESYFAKANDSVVSKIHEILTLDPTGKIISHKIDRTKETYHAHNNVGGVTRNSTSTRTAAKASAISTNHKDSINIPAPVKVQKYVPKIYRVSMWFMVIFIVAGIVYIVLRFGLIDKVKKILSKLRLNI